MARKKEGRHPWHDGGARGGDGAAGSVREEGEATGHGLGGRLGLPSCSGQKRLDGPAGHWADWAES
jgi:hypothetical protein